MGDSSAIGKATRWSSIRGVKTDDFIASVDRLGTPQSDSMHIVERYRLIDGARAKADMAAYEKIEGAIGGRVDGYNPDTNLKGLRLEITMEDPKVFTQPLTAVVTYRPPAHAVGGKPSAPTIRSNITRVSGSACPRRIHPDF